MQRALLILGMHRSGTSALTRVVNLLGARLNPALMKPDAAHNERGFWESEEVMRLHDELLEAIGTTWDETVPLADGWWRRHEAAPIRERLLELLRRDFGDSPLWAIKDPRMCRLLPLWLDLLTELRVEPLCLLIVRSPGEVVDSLQRRSGFSPGFGYPLWLDHVLAAEEHSRGTRRAFLTYDQLLEDWRGAAERVGATLGVDWPVSPDDAAPKIEAFLSPAMRHHRVPADALRRDAELSPWVAQAYDELVHVASDGTDSDAFRSRLDALRENDRQAQQLYGRCLASHRAESRALHGEIRSLEQTRARLEAQLEEAGQELESTMKRQIVDLEKRDDELLQANHLFEARQELAEKQIQQANTTFDDALARKDEQIVNISELLETRTRELDRLRGEFEEQASTLERARRDGEQASALATRITELEAALEDTLRALQSR